MDKNRAFVPLIENFDGAVEHRVWESYTPPIVSSPPVAEQEIQGPLANPDSWEFRDRPVPVEVSS